VGVVLEICRFTCAFVLGYSVLQKCRHRTDLADSLADYGIALPATISRIAARAVPIGEMLIVVLLLTGLGGMIAPLALSLVTFTLYTCVLVYSVMGSTNPHCNCFGSREPVSYATLLRNFALSAVALVGLAVAVTSHEYHNPSYHTVIAGAAAAWILAAILVRANTLGRLLVRRKVQL